MFVDQCRLERDLLALSEVVTAFEKFTSGSVLIWIQEQERPNSYFSPPVKGNLFTLTP
jgi:hypothetical protein